MNHRGKTRLAPSEAGLGFHSAEVGFLFTLQDPWQPCFLRGCCSEGAFAIYPLLGLDRVLISDRRNGFWIVDLTQELLSRLSVEPSAFYAVSDNDSDGVFDDLGDAAADVSASDRSQVGEVDSLATNKMNRLVAKFALPDAPGRAPFLERATLRFFLQDIVGTPAGPLSVRHSITDNDLDLLASDYENPSYVDTLLDLIQPTDPDGQYYELDVTLHESAIRIQQDSGSMIRSAP